MNNDEVNDVETCARVGCDRVITEVGIDGEHRFAGLRQNR